MSSLLTVPNASIVTEKNFTVCVFLSAFVLQHRKLPVRTELNVYCNKVCIHFFRSFELSELVNSFVGTVGI